MRGGLGSLLGFAVLIVVGYCALASLVGLVLCVFGWCLCGRFIFRGFRVFVRFCADVSCVVGMVHFCGWCGLWWICGWLFVLASVCCCLCFVCVHLFFFWWMFFFRGFFVFWLRLRCYVFSCPSLGIVLGCLGLAPARFYVLYCAFCLLAFFAWLLLASFCLFVGFVPATGFVPVWSPAAFPAFATAASRCPSSSLPRMPVFRFVPPPRPGR